MRYFPSVFAVGDDKKKKERGGKERKGKEREGKVTQSHKTLYFGYLWGGHP